VPELLGLFESLVRIRWDGAPPRTLASPWRNTSKLFFSREACHFAFADCDLDSVRLADLVGP